MAFKCTGFEHAPSPQQLPPAVVKKECSGEETSCFLWDYEVKDDKLKFTTRILVRNDLRKTELADVLAHERHHWRDFQNRAIKLKDAVEKALKAGRDPALDDRLEWMLYDYCKDSAAFHRSIERYPIPICFEPKSTRPE